jgi:hypothetical protein
VQADGRRDQFGHATTIPIRAAYEHGSLMPKTSARCSGSNPVALCAVRRSALGRAAAVLVGVVCHVVLLRQGSLIHMARGT